MVSNFSDTMVEFHAIQRQAFAASTDVHDTIWKSRRLIQDCRELMAEVDEILGRGIC